MFPQFEILGRTFGTYAWLSAVAAFFCGLLFCIMIKRRGLDNTDAIVFCLFLVVGILVGGHLMYGLVQIPKWHILFAPESLPDFVGRFLHIFGGSVFYGGLLGGGAAGVFVIKKWRLDPVVYTDCIAPIIPLFHTFGRIGCFLGGCCYGIESRFGFAAQHNPYVPELNGVTRFPVQLLEAGLNLILSGILFLLLRRTTRTGRLRGMLLLIYGMSYAVIRFFDEFLRGDAARGFVGPLSVSQFISLLLFTASSLILLFKKHLKKKDESA